MNAKEQQASIKSSKVVEKKTKQAMTWGATSCKNKHKMQTHEMSKKKVTKKQHHHKTNCAVQYNINLKPRSRKEKIA